MSDHSFLAINHSFKTTTSFVNMRGVEENTTTMSYRVAHTKKQSGNCERNAHPLERKVEGHKIGVTA